HDLEKRIADPHRARSDLLEVDVSHSLQLAGGDGEGENFGCSRIAAPSSATWNGFPAILLNPLASTRYAARSSCTSWPLLSSGTSTRSKRRNSSPRFLGNGLK